MPTPIPGFVPMQFCRNGLPPPGQYARALARAANEIAGKFGNLWPGKSVLPNGARNTASNLRLWTQRIRTGPNGTILVVRVRCIPTDTTAGTPRWYVTLNGVAQTEQTHNVRCASGSGTTFDDVFEMEQEITVTRDTMYTVDLSTRDNCRVIGWSLHEKPRELVVGTDTCIDITRILPLSGICDADWASLQSVIDKIVKNIRGAALMFHVDDPASPIVAGTAFANIWESTNTMGSAVETEFKNTYMNEVLAARSIPCRIWTLAARTAGAGNGTVRFIGGNHAGGVDLTVNAALGVVEDTANFTLRAITGGDSLKVHAQAPGGTTVNVHAVGCLPILT